MEMVVNYGGGQYLGLHINKELWRTIQQLLIKLFQQPSLWNLQKYKTHFIPSQVWFGSG